MKESKKHDAKEDASLYASVHQISSFPSALPFASSRAVSIASSYVYYPRLEAGSRAAATRRARYVLIRAAFP